MRCEAIATCRRDPCERSRDPRASICASGASAPQVSAREWRPLCCSTARELCLQSTRRSGSRSRGATWRSIVVHRAIVSIANWRFRRGFSPLVSSRLIASHRSRSLLRQVNGRQVADTAASVSVSTRLDSNRDLFTALTVQY